jgi:hypothetical protein
VASKTLHLGLGNLFELAGYHEQYGHQAKLLLHNQCIGVMMHPHVDQVMDVK